MYPDVDTVGMRTTLLIVLKGYFSLFLGFEIFSTKPDCLIENDSDEFYSFRWFKEKLSR